MSLCQKKRARIDTTPGRQTKGPSHEEPRQDNPMAYGNMVTVRVAERLRNTVRKMEGLHPR